MLVVAAAEVERVGVLQDLAQVVATLDFVLDLAEDLADLVFDRFGALGPLAEAG